MKSVVDLPRHHRQNSKSRLESLAEVSSRRITEEKGPPNRQGPVGQNSLWPEGSVAIGRQEETAGVQGTLQRHVLLAEGLEAKSCS